tara:strand:- start:254 stop:379 length:126 start_codon:yes stop_codon:yes gene_type:complete
MLIFKFFIIKGHKGMSNFILTTSFDQELLERAEALTEELDD